MAPLSPEALAAYPRRLEISRTNPYLKPGGYLDVAAGLQSFETRQCGSGVSAFLDPATPSDPDFNERFDGDAETAQLFFDRIQAFAFVDQLDTNAITRRRPATSRRRSTRSASRPRPATTCTSTRSRDRR